MKKSILLSLLVMAFCSCENQDWEFDDFDYSTVYFAYQYPVRTLTMGEDVFNTDLDNEHKCKIVATWGGGYTNKNNVTIDVKVDESLCAEVAYKDNGADVLAMPSNYYQLAANRITIPSGSISGGVEVQLTEEFFADPLALQRNYVIPLVMTQAQNVDSILQGSSSLPESERNRLRADDWMVVPKDYILYAVKYINTWDGNYLRRGVDVITSVDGTQTTVVRHQKYVENDEISKLNTMSLSELEYPITFKNESGTYIPVPVKMTFDGNNCTVGPKGEIVQINDSVKAYNISSTGSGKFVVKGEKNSWGGKDRDALYVEYTLKFDLEMSYPTTGKPTDYESFDYATKDTLVARDRGVKMETYEVVMK